MNKENTFLSRIISKPIPGLYSPVLMLFRCIRRDRAEQFRRGEIYFGSPRQWINLEKDGNKGQGDILEGTFLSTHADDNSVFIKELKTNTSIEFFDHNGFTFFRRKAVVDLRCLCLYGIQDNSFWKERSSDGRVHYYTRITKKYFSDFTDYKTREEYKKTDSLLQPVVVFINNPQVFFSRIRAFLESLDVKEEEIIISPIEYCDRYTRMCVETPSPAELLLKDNAFEEQSEVRIIINSISPKYRKYMLEHNNTLALGSLEDITDIYNYYFDDLSIEKHGNRRIMFSLPEKTTYQIQDMDFFDLEDLLYNILQGTVKLTGIPDGEKTLEEKLKPISNLLYSKYGVVLHVDERKHVFLYNMTPDLIKQSHERYKHAELQYKFEKRINNLIVEKKEIEARDECIHACKDVQFFGIANYYLGKIYSSQGRYQDAIDAFHKAFLNDCKRIESLDGIASIHFMCAEYKKAIDLYYAMQDEKGYDGRIWCNIGICHVKLKQYEKAIELFDMGIAFDETDAFPYYNKGVALYMLRQYDQAKENMKKAIELDSQNEIYKREFLKCFPNLPL